MREAEIYLEQIKAMSTFLETQVAELPDDLLYQRPAPQRNPVGFIYWHILRIWDLDLSLCDGIPLSEDRWHRYEFGAKAGYNPDGLGLRGLGMGVGYTDAEVDGVQIARAVLREYHQVLLEDTTAYLEQASDEVLRMARPSPLNSQGTMTATERTQHTIAHSYGHIGELRFVKGMHGFSDPTYPKS